MDSKSGRNRKLLNQILLAACRNDKIRPAIERLPDFVYRGATFCHIAFICLKRIMRFCCFGVTALLLRGEMMMQSRFLKKLSISICMVMCMSGYATIGSAHSGSATMDPEGISRTFTGLAFITCFDDGNGEPHHLIARIRDNSPPVSGLLTNLQLYKGDQAVSISDTISGDADFSPFVTLHGGPGVYWLIVNKTNKGARSFDIDWHCNTITDVHTGTDIGVAQFE